MTRRNVAFLILLTVTGYLSVEAIQAEDEPGASVPEEVTAEVVPVNPDQLKVEAKENARQVSDQRGDAEEEVLSEVMEIKRAEATKQAEQEAAVQPDMGPPAPAEVLRKEILPVVFYASVRLNLIDDTDGFTLADGGSRVGAMLETEDRGHGSLFGRAEFGVNLVNELSYLVTTDASSQNGRTGPLFNPRLYFIGYDYEGFRTSYGKSWSVYYDVAGRADAFAVYGGRAAGVYNAGTDGGGSGTGRADHAFQFRNRNIMAWRFGLQAQHDTLMPSFEDETFEYGLSASLRHTLDSGVGFGVAYAMAEPKRITDDMREQGLRGTDQAWAVSLHYQRNDWYLASVFANLRNHENDEEGQFFNGRGWETYLRRNLSKRLRSVAGWNFLRPRDDGYDGLYNVEEYILGMQYTFGKMTFDDMVYIEYSMNQTVSSEGASVPNVLAVGMRWKWLW